MSKQEKLPTFSEIHELIEMNYDAPSHLKPNVGQLIEEYSDFVFVRDEESDHGELIGVSFYQEITPNLVKTFRTVVHEKCRRQGVGKRLNDQLEEIFKRKGYKKIVCYIYTDNLPSLFLKLKRGYLVEGLQRNHDYEGVHEYVMGKEL